MDSFLEQELKLDPPDGFQLPPLDGEELASRLFTSTYWDTPPRSLARSAITLRRRLENGVSRWQLKLPRDEHARAEIESLGGPAGPPADIAALLRAHLRHGPLEPVATLQTRRVGVRVADQGRPIADVTLDDVQVLDDGRTAGHFVELEVELVDGDRRDLTRLGRLLRDAGARETDGRPKLMRVIDVEELSDPGDDATALERIRYLLALQLREIEAHDPGVRRGDDAEDVHQFRVATRRTRAIIRATRPLLGETLAPLGNELKWLAGSLGEVRDLDVLLENLRGEAEGLGDDTRSAELLLAALGREHDQRRTELLQALDSDRYLALLDTFAAAVASLPELDAPDGLQPLAADALRKLRKAYRSTPDDPADDELHALRIHAKRARYAAELVGGGKRVREYLAALKEVQDVVGGHQDAVVAEAKLRAVATAGSAVAAGRLIERERMRRARCRAEYRDAVETAIRRGRKAFD
jgi:CHAD domain-containing protein